MEHSAGLRTSSSPTVKYYQLSPWVKAISPLWTFIVLENRPDSLAGEFSRILQSLPDSLSGLVVWERRNPWSMWHMVRVTYMVWYKHQGNHTGCALPSCGWNLLAVNNNIPDRHSLDGHTKARPLCPPWKTLHAWLMLPNQDGRASGGGQAHRFASTCQSRAWISATEPLRGSLVTAE